MDDINALGPPGSPWVPRPQALPGRMVPQSPVKTRGKTELREVNTSVGKGTNKGLSWDN